MNIVRRFLEHARERPAQSAVIHGRTRFSYSECKLRSDEVFFRLLSDDLGPESVVCVLLGRSIDSVTTALGVLRAGACYLFLDPKMPEERLVQIVRQCGPSLIVTASNLRAQAERISCGTSVYSLGDGAPGASTLEVVDVRPHNLAYVVYTSGSTGEPKGCMNTFGGLNNRIEWMQDTFALQPAECVLHKTPLTFDVSLWEYLWPLSAGGICVVCPEEATFDPLRIASLIDEHEITTAHFVPSLLRAFLKSTGAKALLRLSRILCSGEELRSSTLSDLKAIGSTSVFNLYGPAEAAIDVTCSSELSHDSAQDNRIPIGSAIVGCRAIVLDENMEPVPAGTVGELYIGGACLGRGYRNDPRLTAQRFVPNLVAEVPGDRLYRTGDRAVCSPGGELFFRGRVDRQVKVRGARVELGEIEHSLCSIPGVEDAIVFAEGAHFDAPTLEAQVATSLLTADSVRRSLVALLPSYMIPTHITCVPQLATTAHGKRSSTPTTVPNDTQPLAEPSFADRIKIIVEDLLSETLPSLQADIFEHGAHSLTFIELQSVLEAEFGVQVPVRILFDSPTVESIASAVESEHSGRQLDDIEAALRGLEALTPVELEDRLKRELQENRQ